MQTNIAESVIDAFGGQTKTARACGVPISTVDSWKRKGRIPPWRRPAIIAAARGASVDLPEAFLGTEAA